MVDFIYLNEILFRKRMNQMFFIDFTDIDFYQWDIDFYPRGIRYGKAQIINVYNLPGSEEIPEVLLKTVRLSVTCKSRLEVDQRFMVNFSYSFESNSQDLFIPFKLF